MKFIRMKVKIELCQLLNINYLTCTCDYNQIIYLTYFNQIVCSCILPVLIRLYTVVFDLFLYGLIAFVKRYEERHTLVLVQNSKYCTEELNEIRVMVFNANFSNISAISWGEQILLT